MMIASPGLKMKTLAVEVAGPVEHQNLFLRHDVPGLAVGHDLAPHSEMIVKHGLAPDIMEMLASQSFRNTTGSLKTVSH